MNKSIFYDLKQDKVSIEQQTGQLVWAPLEIKKASRIFLIRDSTTIKDALADEKASDWLLTALPSLRYAFGGRLRTLTGKPS